MGSQDIGKAHTPARQELYSFALKQARLVGVTGRTNPTSACLFLNNNCN